MSSIAQNDIQTRKPTLETRGAFVECWCDDAIASSCQHLFCVACPLSLLLHAHTCTAPARAAPCFVLCFLSSLSLFLSIASLCCFGCNNAAGYETLLLMVSSQPERLPYVLVCTACVSYIDRPFSPPRSLCTGSGFSPGVCLSFSNGAPMCGCVSLVLSPASVCVRIVPGRRPRVYPGRLLEPRTQHPSGVEASSGGDLFGRCSLCLLCCAPVWNSRMGVMPGVTRKDSARGRRARLCVGVFDTTQRFEELSKS